MHEVGKPSTFAAGKIYNLKADPFIAEHCDVTGREVAYAAAAAHRGAT